MKAELYWTNEWKDESELTEADKVGTSGLYAIKGWQSTGDSNIKEIAVEWSASKKLSEAKAATDGMLTGYLHVKVVPNGDEIHSDNDWGYVRMALLAPTCTRERTRRRSLRRSSRRQSRRQPPPSRR